MLRCARHNANGPADAGPWLSVWAGFGSLSLLEIGVDSTSGTFARRDCEVNERRAAYVVTTCKDTGATRLARLRVDFQQAPAVCLQALCRFADDRVGPEADREDHVVDLYLELRALDGHRAAAARAIRIAQLHADHPHVVNVAVAVGAEKLSRGGEVLDTRALLDGVAALGGIAGHLGFGAAVVAHNILRAETHGGAQAVGCRVTPADDRNAVADLAALLLAFGQQVVGEVGASEEVERAVDAAQVLTGDAQRRLDLRPGADKDRGTALALHQFIERDVSADAGVKHKLDAEVGKPVDLPLYEVFAELKIRDAVHQQPARCRLLLKDGDLVPGDGEVFGGSEACRPCANHRHAFAAARRDLWQGDAGRLALVVGNKRLQRTRVDGPLAAGQHTACLTACLAGAHPPADLRHRVGAAVKLRRFDEPPLLDEPQRLGDVVAHRAGADAWRWLRAVQAARRLLHGLLRREADCALLEVVNSLADLPVHTLNGGDDDTRFPVDVRVLFNRKHQQHSTCRLDSAHRVSIMACFNACQF